MRTMLACVLCCAIGTGCGPKVPKAPSTSNAMPLRVFKATQPKAPTQFTLLAQIGSYYARGYSDKKESMWAIGLGESDTGEELWGYVRKDSESGKNLYRLLQDGKVHVATLDLIYDVPEADVESATITTFRTP